MQELDDLHDPLGDVVAPLRHRRSHDRLFYVAVDAPCNVRAERVKALRLPRSQFAALLSGRDVDVIDLARDRTRHGHAVDGAHQVVDCVLRRRGSIEQRVPGRLPRPLVQIERHQGHHAVPIKGGAVVHQSAVAMDQQAPLRVHAAIVFRSLALNRLAAFKASDLLADIRDFVVPACADLPHLQLFADGIAVRPENRLALLIDLAKVDSHVEDVRVEHVGILL